jgi:hypothetical protein
MVWSYYTTSNYSGSEGKFDLSSTNSGDTMKMAIMTLDTHTHDFSAMTTDSEESHTHDISFTIDQQTYTTDDVRIYTTDDASSSPAWTERTSAIETALGRALRSGDNQSETGIALTTYFSGTGWKGVRFVTNGDSRHKANLTVKCFIRSKTES